MLGGIGEINFGKQYCQGNRVYDSNAIAYNSDGKTEQKIEVRDDELSNAIITAQKSSLVVEKKSWLEKKYTEFYEKHGYIPEYFVPYNGTECTDYAPTLTANSNVSPTHSGTVLIAKINEEEKYNESNDKFENF